MNQPQYFTRADQDREGLIRRVDYPPNFVPAEILPPAREQADVAPMAPAQLPMIPGAPVVHVMDKTTALDRAQAFVLKANVLALLVAVLAGFGAWRLAGLELLTVLLVAIGTFAGVWAWAYNRDIQTSAGGIAYYNARQTWREVRRAAQAHEDAYRRAHGIERKGWGK